MTMDWCALFAALAADGAPLADLGIDVTAAHVAVPETPEACRAGDQAHEHMREEMWLRSCEAMSDEWTDEPTIREVRT